MEKYRIIQENNETNYLGKCIQYQINEYYESSSTSSSIDKGAISHIPSKSPSWK